MSDKNWLQLVNLTRFGCTKLERAQMTTSQNEDQMQTPRTQLDFSLTVKAAT